MNAGWTKAVALAESNLVGRVQLSIQESDGSQGTSNDPDSSVSHHHTGDVNGHCA